MVVDKIQSKFLLVFILLGLSLGANAQYRPELDLMEGEDKPRSALENKFIQDNIALSEWFDRMTNKVDLFLTGGRRTTKRAIESYVRIQNTSYSLEGEGAKNETVLSINPRFPHLEEYWKLKFTTYDERENRRGLNNNYLRRGPRQRNVGATVGLFKKLGNIRTAFEPRIELQDPLKVSHSISFESDAEYKKYKISPKLEFFANPTRGTGTYQSIDFFLVLDRTYSLNFINDSEYLEKERKFSVTNGVSIGQAVTEYSGLSYNFFVGSNNRETYHLESYSPSITWGQIVYRKILDYTLTTHLDFSKVNNFKGRSGLTFSVNLNF